MKLSYINAVVMVDTLAFYMVSSHMQLAGEVKNIPAPGVEPKKPLNL